MKTATTFLITVALATTSTSSAFQPSSSSPTTTTTTTTHTLSSSSSSSSSTTLHGYVPSGFTKESYEKFKKEEAAKKKKNLGRMGPKGFKSRSFQSFQEALERGETTHLMPVMNAKERVKKGELKPEDIPYMQRGGAWDNSDVRGAKKVKWLASDKEYANGGYKKEQSVSIFGVGQGLDWTGTREKSSPYQQSKAATKGRNGANNKNNNDDDDKPKKKLFGIF